MGIIAGIAVPVTIAVINRQKKNAAAKSAEALVATIKQVCNELSATAVGNITVTLTYTPAENATYATSPTSVDINAGTGVDVSGYGEADFKVENFKAKGTLVATYNVTDATYSWSYGSGQGAAFLVNNYTITVNADGSCKAS